MYSRCRQFNPFVIIFASYVDFVCVIVLNDERERDCLVACWSLVERRSTDGGQALRRQRVSFRAVSDLTIFIYHCQML